MEQQVIERGAAQTSQLPQPSRSVRSISAVPRFNLYMSIHKGIRAFMSSTLEQVGAMDVADADEVAAALAGTRELLAFCQGHLEHENEYIHTAMQARQPDSSLHTAADHVEHVQAIGELSELVTEVDLATGGAKNAAANRLYRQLALFIAENFEHMNIEETGNNAVLWANYTDPELIELHGRILASVAPAEMAIAMKWMVPAVTHGERVGMFSGMRQGMPEPVFHGVLASVKPLLSDRNWAKLERALSL